MAVSRKHRENMAAEINVAPRNFWRAAHLLLKASRPWKSRQSQPKRVYGEQKSSRPGRPPSFSWGKPLARRPKKRKSKSDLSGARGEACAGDMPAKMSGGGWCRMRAAQGAPMASCAGIIVEVAVASVSKQPGAENASWRGWSLSGIWQK